MVVKETTGALYVCATPIGNLEDITLRALKVLGEVQLIAAEDTRRTRKLLTHYDIHTPLISYHQHNRLSRIPELVSKLKSGADIALVSDAGTPGISDPGQEIIQIAIQEGISVIPIPGASAVLAGLIIAGYETDIFTFCGFVPRGRREKRQFLEEVSKWSHTVVLYEAPHRLIDTLQVFGVTMPQRPLAICRELTKVHEEVVRGLPQELLEHFEAVSPRGEFVLVLSAQRGEQLDTESNRGEPEEMVPIPAAVLQLMAEGVEKKAAIKQVARERGVSRRDVYRAVIDIPAQPCPMK
jgi:16S rRNA (cytidine1402-2'-O)-methyltransferase